MEPTIVKPGVNEDRALAPTASAAPVEAHQRAPTLMAGEHSGQEVQVWAPDRWRLWLPTMLWVGIWLVTLLKVLFSPFRTWKGRFTDARSALSHLPILLSLNRPSYLTTDEVGIAVTRWPDGTIARRWDEIQGLAITRLWSGYLLALSRRADSSIIFVNLAGYPRRRREALVAHITAKTGLGLNSLNSPPLGRSSLAPQHRTPDL